MEYFKTSIKSVLVGQQDTQLSEAEIVEKLVERVQTSPLEDRRDACRALKSLSKKFRVEVGAQGMNALLTILKTDRNDCEIVSYALDTLSNIIYGTVDEDGSNELNQEAENIGVQFTEIYIKKAENVTLLVDILEESDFQVRWAAVKLLTSLLINKPKEVQECIISSPMGVSRLMDNLTESREIIRNDTLLLLAHLTKGNANIQKIVAFENAFDLLFGIIKEEGYCDGGIVIEDSLIVLHNLLKNNTSNQIFFKEGSYIHKITDFFDINLDMSGPDKGWLPQRRTNIHMMLQVIRTLISPNNPLQVTFSSQKIINQCGLLEKLCLLLMASGVPVDVLTETISTVAEAVRGHHGNQEYFSSLNAPSSPPRSAIVVLLMSMVNERQPFILRCAVLYCFQCFLYKNELGQAQIVQTLLPSTSDIANVTAGQLLCGGLFSSDSLSNWFATVALSHTLVDNTIQKEQLLRVQLATSVGNPPVSLLKQCSIILQQGGKAQTRLGLLMLLSTWLAHCSLAVSHFVSIPTNIPFLTSQVGLTEGDEHESLVQGLCAFLLGICVEFNDNSVPSFTRDDLCQLVTKRVKLEMFLDKLNLISKHENYGIASQKPQLKYFHSSDVIFDFEFCKLFKSLEGTVIKAVQPKSLDLLNGPECNMTDEQYSLLQQYKDVIRSQDQQICSLKKELEALEVEYDKANTNIQEMTTTIQRLKDQNALLKAHKSFSSSSGENSPKSNEVIVQVKHELKELKQMYKNIQEELKGKTDAVEKLHEEQEVLDVDTKLQPTEADFLRTIKEQREEISKLKATIKDLESQVETLQEQNIYYQKLNEENQKAQTENEITKAHWASLQSEQDDLHMLISDQDAKLTMYRERLKELGEEVEDEDLDLEEFDDKID